MTKSSTSIKSENEQVQQNETIEKLEQMLAAVLHYLSDDEIEEIDIDYLLTNTEDLREWWEGYRKRNKKKLENEIKASLGTLSLEELEKIHEQIKKHK
ncbi:MULTISPECIES: hypothetical protein [Bacillaceae]|uniref:hypothetical protein n=1 Tax=Bacillaceae TaxID=186817 RepID=UPI001C57FEE9|nr:hypothetical protein [Rossellomorea sp. YZS02]MBW3114646.1 hypothetical protein [Bacillus sp. MCCB 382]MDX8345692.1 hypothetical protein [Rossellomorea sp. YZS02]